MESSMSLRFKINLLLLLIFALLASALVWQQLRSTRVDVQQEFAMAGTVASRVLARIGEVNQDAGAAAVQTFLERLGRVPAVEITRYDQLGKALYRSPPNPNPLGREVPAWFMQLLSPAQTDQRLDLADGQVVIHPSASRAALAGWDECLLLLAIVGGGYLLLSLLVYWLIGRAMKPLHRVVEALHQVGEGNYQTRLPTMHGAEARALGRTFNDMAASIDRNLTARAAQARTEGEQARNQAQRQAMQRRIDHEQQAFGRDLHDELGQHVTAIKSMGVSISRRVADDQSPIAQAADLIVASADRVHAGMNDMVTRLRPVALDQLGLADALGELITDWRGKLPQMQFTLRIGPELDQVPPEVATAAFRIAQEAVTNAVRHSQAQLIEVNLRAVDAAIVLQVQDNGQGPPEGRLEPGFGLTGMLERASLVDGVVEFGRSRLGGVQVRARLPLGLVPAADGEKARDCADTAAVAES